MVTEIEYTELVKHLDALGYHDASKQVADLVHTIEAMYDALSSMPCSLSDLLDRSPHWESVQRVLGFEEDDD